jgi:hypothetical protein
VNAEAKGLVERIDDQYEIRCGDRSKARAYATACCNLEHVRRRPGTEGVAPDEIAPLTGRERFSYD